MSHAVDVALHSDSLRDQASAMSSDSFDPSAMPVTHLSNASCCARAGDSCNRCVAWARVHPRIVWGIVLVVAIGGGLLIAVSLLPIDKWMQSSQDYITANQAASIAVLFSAMFVGVMVFLPVSLIETAGSFFFGWKIGFPVTFAGYWLGSMVALLLGRQCCMECVPIPWFLSVRCWSSADSLSFFSFAVTSSPLSCPSGRAAPCLSA